MEISLNKNIVVYEATKKPESTDHFNHVIVYWMKIDPKSRAARRKKGIMTDKKDLNWIENQQAFGFGIKATANKKEYRIVMNRLPDLVFTLITDANGTPHIKATINNKPCYLRK